MIDITSLAYDGQKSSTFSRFIMCSRLRVVAMHVRPATITLADADNLHAYRLPERERGTVLHGPARSIKTFLASSLIGFCT